MSRFSYFSFLFCRNGSLDTIRKVSFEPIFLFFFSFFVETASWIPSEKWILSWFAEFSFIFVETASWIPSERWVLSRFSYFLFFFVESAEFWANLQNFLFNFSRILKNRHNNLLCLNLFQIFFPIDVDWLPFGTLILFDKINYLSNIFKKHGN